MKIKNIHITGFGKFKDKDIHFKEGFNLVFGKNEAGKSTLQAFIKIMLFGFSTQRTDGEGRFSEIKKYKPWSVSEFSGNMEINIINGRLLRIERDFTKKTTFVYDDTFELITPEFPYTKKDGLLIGETLLNMDRECFENTAFIKQGSTHVLQENRKNLFEKLVNLSQTGNEKISSANTVSAITKTITALGNPRTKNRPYNNAKEMFDKYDVLLNQAREKKVEMASYKERRYVLESKLTLLAKKLKDENFLRDSRKLFDEKEKLEQIKKRYTNKIYDIKMIDKRLCDYKTNLSKLHFPKNIKEQEILEYIKKTAVAIEKQKNISIVNPEVEYTRLEKAKKQKRIFLFLYYMGITFSIAAAILFYPFLLFATAVLIVFLFFSLFRKNRFSNRNIAQQIKLAHECKESLLHINTFIESADYKASSSLSEAEITLSSFFATKKTSSTLKQQIALDEARKTDLLKSADEIPGMFGTILKVEERIDVLSRQIIKKGMRKEQFHSYSETDDESLFEKKQRELAGINMLLEKYMHSDDEVAEIEENLAFFKRKLYIISEAKNALGIASKTLTEAIKVMQEDIIPKLNSKMGTILRRITDNHHTNLLTGPDKALNTKYDNNVRSIWDFSDGTIDQMYFALRIATADVFSEKESLPLLIDEAFAYYDEDRMNSTFDFLNEISKTRQVILFTCKERELELVSKIQDVNIIML